MKSLGQDVDEEAADEVPSAAKRRGHTAAPTGLHAANIATPAGKPEDNETIVPAVSAAGTQSQ